MLTRMLTSSPNFSPTDPNSNPSLEVPQSRILTHADNLTLPNTSCYWRQVLLSFTAVLNSTQQRTTDAGV